MIEKGKLVTFRKYRSITHQKNYGYHPDILLVWFDVWFDVTLAPVSLNVVMLLKLASELLLVSFASSSAEPISVLFPVVLL
jgi:hypothetical protein